jgi:hypothetical protein
MIGMQTPKAIAKVLLSSSPPEDDIGTFVFV